MTFLRPLLLLALCALPAALAASPFEEGNTLYDQQKYPEAKSHYEEQLRTGPVSANLLYDLGNTEYRLGHAGRAVLEYERALLLEPAHQEARGNLALVRSQTGAQALLQPVTDYLIPPWPPAVFSVTLAAGAWLALFAAAALAPSRRRESLTLWLGFATGAALAGWSGFVLWREAVHETVAIVLPAQTDVRTDPADRSALVAPLPAGSQVRVLGERGAWTYCELPGSRRGWLASTDIERLRPARGS